MTPIRARNCSTPELQRAAPRFSFDIASGTALLVVPWGRYSRPVAISNGMYADRDGNVTEVVSLGVCSSAEAAVQGGAE